MHDRVFTVLKRQVQTAIRVLFPPACIGCGSLVETEFALCSTCWRDVPFISGPVCDACGVPILVRNTEETGLCDTCHKNPRPWTSGRAALRYDEVARKLVLGLKHSERQDVARAAGGWLQQAARPLVFEDTVIAPIPLHWRRLLKRRYNQSALLAVNLGQRIGRLAVVDMLERTRHTQPLDGIDVAARFERLEGAITVSEKRRAQIEGRAVLLIDDVMTSGATFSAASKACLAAGARRVDVLALARVAKDT